MAYFTLYENGSLIIGSDHERVIPDRLNGNKKKQYHIDNDCYRKIASSAVNLWKQRKHKPTFFTLTFPFEPTEEVANNCFSKFVENLKKNYELTNYIAVKERGEEKNRLHYHAIFDIAFKDIRSINMAWCATFRSYHSPTSNAVRLPKFENGGAIIKSQKRCVRYICKYIGKEKDRAFYDKPCIFISRDCISKPIRITQEQCEQLKHENYFQAYTSKYSTCITFYQDKDKINQKYFDNLQ